MDLLAAAKKAVRETSLYANIYCSEPNDVSEIPFISLSAYHRAQGILDCIADREAMIGIIRHAIDLPPTSLLVVEHCDGPLIHDLSYPAWLYADELDLIGSRPAGREYFDYDREQLMLENEPFSELTHISKLKSSCFPLIRYGVNISIPTESR